MASTSTYIGGLVFKDNAIDYLPTAEGRVTKISNNNWNYEYFMKDHLGSVRMSFDKDPGTGNARIIQENAYYSFGGEMPGLSWIFGVENLLKYNGKEEQKQWQVIDYGWRFEDRDDPCFITQDRFAGKYYFLSPYQYGVNNPIRYIDVNGDSIYIFHPDGTHMGTLDDGREKVTGLYFKDSKTNKKGKTTYSNSVSFEFNDIESDRASIQNKTLKVSLVGQSDVDNEMAKSGVDDVGNQQNSWSYIERESRPASNESLLSGKSNGNMDYVTALKPRRLYVVQDKSLNIAYNNFDYGNFLWGQGGKRLGFSYSILKAASHLNNAANSRSDNPTIPYRILDSSADQRAIYNGYNYGEYMKQLDPQE